MRKVVGIDIGATNLRVLLLDEKGKVLQSALERTDHEGVIAQIQRNVDKINGFEAIGISSIGPLDTNKGVILNPPNSTIRNLPIAHTLNKMYDVPTLLLNDCVAAVVAEKFLGAGKSVSNMVYITFSTGIGAGVIIDDRLVLGKDGNAHEVGHWTLEYGSALECGCGAKGHWEAFASGKNIPNFARHLANTTFKKQVKGHGMEIKILDTKGLFEKARSDATAKGIVEQIGKINAIGIANVVNAYDPQMITIGGSVMLKNADVLLPIIRKEAPAHVVNRMPIIEITELGDEICAIGAGAAVLNSEWIGKSLRR